MITRVLHPDKDPMGRLLKDYLAGDRDAFLTVDSAQLDMSKMYGKTLFRLPEQMDDQETCALKMCRGKILDVGAGSGCHSLVLQDAGKNVTALEVSPGAIDVLAQRGVKQRLFDSLFNLNGQCFDTLLMLMNGIGICGTIDGLNYFFQYARQILNPGGQILADSTDLCAMHTRLPLMADSEEIYYGETEFVMSYKAITSDPFDWLYIDYATLSFYAEFHGWKCRQVTKTLDGKFLARIY